MLECLDIAKTKSGKEIRTPTLLFRQSGRRAGVCSVRFGRGFVVLNYDLVHKVNTYDEQLNCTLPHEVAHWVDHEINGGWHGDPHGYNWKRIMGWFGADPEVRHNMDMTGVKVRRRDTTLFRYKCNCGYDHRLSIIRHRRAQDTTRGYRVCKMCHGKLVYVGIVVNGITAPVAQRIEVPRETVPVIPPIRKPEPLPEAKFRVVTKFVNGSLQNVKVPLDSL